MKKFCLILLCCTLLLVVGCSGQKKISEGIYLHDGNAAEVEAPMDTESLEHAATVFKMISDRYFKGTDVNVYLSVIPDKNCFLAEDAGATMMDYDEFYKTVQEQNSYMTYIPIHHLLELDDYYRTDPHWKQENILPVAEALAVGMGTELSTQWSVQECDVDFYGSYCAELEETPEPDTLRYLESTFLESVQVNDLQNSKIIPVYDMDKLQSDNPYDMYLGGALSLVTIENPNATTDKELVIFRDSFAGSIAPLLCEAYAKVTLIDIRYLISTFIGNFVDFTDQDVLFLYSTSVLNHSQNFK